MKRSSFKAPGAKPTKIAKQIGPEYTLRNRDAAVAVAGPARALVAVAKEHAVQHAGYMTAVRNLPCFRCGIVGFTQFCHADEGKGMSIKTDCRLGWPGCGPHGYESGCHWFVGTSGRMGKKARRVFEKEAGLATREQIRAMGHWPDTLSA